MVTPKGLDLTVTPMEYFHDKVSSASDALRIELDDNIEFYIVNLLCEFIDPQKLGSALAAVDVLDTPLAIQLKKAMESPPSHQLKLYKSLGDTSLYFAGFFQDFFNRKTFDIDYYITMGSTAYNSIAAIMRDRHRDEHFTAVYHELAEQFAKLVEVIAEVSESTEQQQVVNILSVYNRWSKSNSERLRRTLERLGIDPINTPLKLAQ